MLAAALASAVALLAAFTSAAPYSMEEMADNPNLELSNLLVNDSSTGTTFLFFNVQNPEPLAAQGVANCSCQWDREQKNWPVSASAVRCVNSTSLTFFIDTWNNATSFAIAIQDRFHDSSIGKPPYDVLATFSRAWVNNTVIEYDNPDAIGPPILGLQLPNVTIQAAVYAVSS